MNSIYEPATIQELTHRIDTLKPGSQRQWGKMDVAQMLAHCSIPLEVALGERIGQRTLMGRIFGRFAKSIVTNEAPFKQGLPTNPDFIIPDQRDFSVEKQRLKNVLNRFSTAGAAKMENRKHPFFGILTAKEWSNAMVKHIDHHLRQFGV